ARADRARAALGVPAKVLRTFAGGCRAASEGLLLWPRQSAVCRGRAWQLFRRRGTQANGCAMRQPGTEAAEANPLPPPQLSLTFEGTRSRPGWGSPRSAAATPRHGKPR